MLAACGQHAELRDTTLESVYSERELESPASLSFLPQSAHSSCSQSSFSDLSESPEQHAFINLVIEYFLKRQKLSCSGEAVAQCMEEQGSLLNQ